MLVTPIACLMFNKMEWLSKLQIQGFVKQTTTELHEKSQLNCMKKSQPNYEHSQKHYTKLIINFYQTN